MVILMFILPILLPPVRLVDENIQRSLEGDAWTSYGTRFIWWLL